MFSKIVVKVAPYFDFRDLVRAGAVCRAWRLTVDDDALWERLCQCYSVLRRSELESFRFTFARQMGNIPHAPNPEGLTTQSITEALQAVTSSFYALAPFLTPESRTALAQQQVDVLRRHVSRCATTVRNVLPDRIEQTKARSLRLQHEFEHSCQVSLDEISRRADTLLLEAKSRTFYQESFAAFERKVLRRMFQRVPRGVTAGIGCFVDIELRFARKFDKNTTKPGIESILAAEWSVWKETFPLDDTYYNLKDELCYGRGLVGEGSPESRMWRSIQCVLVE